MTSRTDFENFILQLLSYSGLKHPEKYISSASIAQFLRAFTAPSIDENFNYEAFEQLGDVSVNKAVVDYCFKKLDLTNDSKSVKVISKLKSNYASRQGEAEMATKLGFWQFVNATDEEKKLIRKKLLEDVFEGFVGALEYVIEKMHKLENTGYIVAYRFVSKAMDMTFHEDFQKYKEIIINAERDGISKTSALFQQVNDPITKLNEINLNRKYRLEITYHPIGIIASIGPNEEPIKIINKDECYYFYKVYVMAWIEHEFRNIREMKEEVSRIYEKVIRKEEKQLDEIHSEQLDEFHPKKKKMKFIYYPEPEIKKVLENGRVKAYIREILNEEPRGDWDIKIVKFNAAVDALKKLESKGIIWEFQERPSRGGIEEEGIQRCRESAQENDIN